MVWILICDPFDEDLVFKCCSTLLQSPCKAFIISIKSCKTITKIIIKPCYAIFHPYGSPHNQNRPVSQWRQFLNTSRNITCLHMMWTLISHSMHCSQLCTKYLCTCIFNIIGIWCKFLAVQGITAPSSNWNEIVKWVYCVSFLCVYCAYCLLCLPMGLLC